ncbi:MAG: electron transfer flavoprotein subunit beta/FixA family protein [Elusimicrobiota bacterium]
MGLHVVVCVKRTPASTGIAIDASGQVKTEGVPHAMNPLDEYAVEEALRIKEKIADSKVTILSMGTDEADAVIRAGIALGATGGVLVSDAAFAGSCTYGTSYILAQAIKKISATDGEVQLVLFGKQTNDGESGHMTAQVGAWLEWPSATVVRKISEISEAGLTVERLAEDGADTLKYTFPVVVGVTKEINEPRLPSLKGKMGAKKATVLKWGAADLSVDAAAVGKAGALAEVIEMSAIPSRSAGMVIAGETAEDKAKALVEKLKEQKFI